MYSSRLGRLRCLTDNAGNVRGFLGQGDVAAGSPADYDSWGQPLPTGVTPEPGLGFAGEWQDPTGSVSAFAVLLAGSRHFHFT